MIRISEYCHLNAVETQFILNLSDEGIIEITRIDNEPFIAESALSDLDMFTRWHYDMGINLEGIDALRHMILRMRRLQTRVALLEKQLHQFDAGELSEEFDF